MSNTKLFNIKLNELLLYNTDEILTEIRRIYNRKTGILVFSSEIIYSEILERYEALNMESNIYKLIFYGLSHKFLETSSNFILSNLNGHFFVNSYYPTISLNSNAEFIKNVKRFIGDSSNLFSKNFLEM